MDLPVLKERPALEPTRLADVTRRAVDELLAEGESTNTRNSYRAALQYWAAWFALRYGLQLALPVPPEAVMQFIVDHAQRSTDSGLRHELPRDIDQALVDAGYKGKLGPMALNTLVHRVSVLSKGHQLQQVPNPCADPRVRELLSRTRKAYAKRGALPRKKDALTKDPLQAVLATCDDSLKGLRDRALLLFAWSSGGRRRSEVGNADLRFLKRLGGTDFEYELVHSKTNQAGVDRPENHKPLVGIAGQAMDQWLQASGISEGKIFRRVRKGSHLGGALSAAAVRVIVMARCKQAGVVGEFTAHSLRSGFLTESGRQGVPLVESMAMSGHNSVATVVAYTRASSDTKRKVANLMG
jgi:integrase